VNEVMNVELWGAYGAAGLAALWGMGKVKQRAELSLAKHGSLAGHPRTARRIAAMLPSYSYSDEEIFGVDGAPAHIVALRQKAFEDLLTTIRHRFPVTLARSAEVVDALPDLQFVSAYRVPFQFRNMVARGLKIGSFVKSTAGVTLTDLDGNQLYDLTGSYGVNLLGNDFYKRCIEEGVEMVKDLGPMLGAYHPCVVDNVERLKKVSGMDQVSFHMSGTEAVMQAVRVARYHSRRDKVVRFCGSYHGWWGDVQPGIGNPVAAGDTFTLSEMGKNTLRVLRNRNDIACILINPLQALHPNAAAPSDGALLDSARKAGYDHAAYTAWLRELRSVCDTKGIALIFDEVFVGFRLAKGGAQEFFGVRADMVTYGKTLGGGLPVGVVCGKSVWMKRFRDDAPADICFARGTFKEHPYVMGAMNAFLRAIDSPEVAPVYTNQRMKDAGLPVRFANLSSIWTVTYDQPACYNWLFQHYLRLEGVALSWVGTGRIIFSLNFTDSDFAEVEHRFMAAAQKMQADGWWWNDAALTNKAIKRRILREMLAARFNA
jgi:glutamate-1-semialdehyde 2,1-aminomutase